ncbi:MAG: type II toxin-antitoxin system prevent-host-death family antitoxin [Pseudomonadota bacterium]
MPTVIQVNMHEAKSQLSQLAERVWAGDRVVITQAGKPYLDLLPHQPQMLERKPGSLKGRIWIAPDFYATDTDITGSFESST